jgi:hypothetical protein
MIEPTTQYARCAKVSTPDSLVLAADLCVVTPEHSHHEWLYFIQRHPRKDLMPKKNSPTRSKKFDHPQDMAPGSKTPVEVKTPKHPRKSEKR